MKTGVPESKSGSNNWEGDVFERKRYADFLTNYSNSRVLEAGQPLTVALNADWGAGKTYFIENWTKDIRDNNGGVIVFDAWKNDFSNEALISFMAELSIGMKPLRQRISSGKKVAQAIEEQTKSMMHGFRRAAVPASGVIAKGLLKRFTGVAIDEITEALSEAKSDNTKEFDLKSLTAGAEEHLEKGLEAFFEKTLEAHNARSNATEEFRTALESLVKNLQTEQAINGPLYVFVDELDRCRPNYAISLLEGIKHLFSVRGVVFVVSINLNQLSKSVQAVYGSEFDGHSYLKRFFDFEFALPEPDIYGFAQVLRKEDSILSAREIESGLFTRAYVGEDHLARSFERIAVASNLSLRAQRQVWLIASAASTGIPAEQKVHSLWLFFLAALHHSYPSIYEKICSENITSEAFIALCRPVGSVTKSVVDIQRRTRRGDGYGHRLENALMPLIEVLFEYHTACFETLKTIFERADRDETSYPRTMIDEMSSEMPSTYAAGTGLKPSITRYKELVKMAGSLA